MHRPPRNGGFRSPTPASASSSWQRYYRDPLSRYSRQRYENRRGTTRLTDRCQRRISVESTFTRHGHGKRRRNLYRSSHSSDATRVYVASTRYNGQLDSRVKRASRIRAGTVHTQIYGFQFRTRRVGYPHTVHSVRRWVENATARRVGRSRGVRGNKARYILHAYRKCATVRARMSERRRRKSTGAPHTWKVSRERERIPRLVRMADRPWKRRGGGVQTGPGKVRRVSSSSCDTLPLPTPGQTYASTGRSAVDVI